MRTGEAYNLNAGAAAAASGLLLDGVKMYAFLQELSVLMQEAIARDDDKNRNPAFEHGGARHVPLSKACDTVWNNRWDRWLPFVGRARRALGSKDHSRLMGRGVANALHPKGHGADGRRKLGLDVDEFLDELLKDAGAVARLKNAIAAAERSQDHVAQCVARKRACHATYDMIDAYRALFLVKHPSRGAMLKETKRLVAYLYANVMSAGEKWASGEEVEQMRLRAASSAADAAEATADAQEQTERANAPWLRYCDVHREAAIARAVELGLSRRKWMQVLSPWWEESPENPKKKRRQQQQQQQQQQEQTPAPQTEEDVPMPDTPVDGPPPTADPPQDDPMDADRAAVPPRAPPPSPAVASALAQGMACPWSDAWHFAGHLLAEVKELTPPRVANPTMAPPTTRPEKVKIAFITEVGKGQSDTWVTAKHGRFGPAIFAQLADACDVQGVHEIHLLVRVYENAAAARAGTVWERRQRAFDLYCELGLEAAAAHHVRMPGVHPCPNTERYMVVRVSELRERLAALGGALSGGAACVHSADTLRTTGNGRTWWESAALSCMQTEHDTANGGDGANVAKDLLPRTKTKIMLYAVTPRARATACDQEERDQEEQPEDYDHTARVEAGEVVREYAGEGRQTTHDNVEGETAGGETGEVCPSWGATAAFEVLQYLLLERLRGCVILPGSAAAYFAYKMTYDAAVVRRAKRGHKKWTSVILQVLSSGVYDSKKWGQQAVINALELAQSPNKFAKVRVWNGADNRENFEAHVLALVEQLLELQEGGLTVNELLMPMPPCVITLGDENASGERVEMKWHGGAESWEAWLRSTCALGQRAREALVSAVRLHPRLNVTLDGGAWASAAGVRVCAERPSIFTGWSKKEFAQPLEWVWLERGETVRAVAERRRPGDAGYAALARWAACWRGAGGAAKPLGTLTRTPERVQRHEVEEDEGTRPAAPVAPGRFRPTADQAAAEAAEAAARAAAAQTTEATTTWADKRLRDLSPRFGQLAWLAGFESAVDGVCTGAFAGVGPRGRYGIEVPVTERTLARMPVVPEDVGSRPLPNAIWGKLDVMTYAGLCVLHAAMRTGENLFTRVLAPLLEAFPTDGGVERAVNAHLNIELERMGLGKIRTNNQSNPKKVFEASMDGTAAEAWIADLRAGLVHEEPDVRGEWGLERSQSRFLAGMARTLRALGWAQTYQSLLDSLEVLRHWCVGMGTALKYKPAPADYDVVKRELALYVGSKLLRWPASNTWYDNECMYVMGWMHERWGSLRLISQEGMEAFQKKLNEILRMGNGFANAGAIPRRVHEAGEAEKAAYMERRASDKPSEPQWIFEQAMLQQHAYMAEVTAASEDLRTRGEVVTWEEYTLAWRRYMVGAAMRCRLRARYLRGQTREQIARGACAPAGTRYADLLAEHRAYYAPVEVTAADLAPDERAKQQDRARRQRYAALGKDKVYARK